MNPLVIGVDYGTDSVRAVVVDALTGVEEATDVALFKRWMTGQYSNPARNQFRQHPLDYIEGLEAAIRGALAKMPPGAAERVVGIGVDTTGSTPCAVDRKGRPLALSEPFAENPNAMFILWKDHTAVREAEEINRAARTWGGTDFTKYEGGVYSSEWFWAKILHVLREDPAIQEAAYSWVEHCDWLPALLTGTENPDVLKRSRCAAGHKAMWHGDWAGLPTEEFLTRVDPLLAGLRGRLFAETCTSEQKAGDLTPEWACRLGLPAGISVAVGAFDAHMGAVGARITEGTLVKIMGTSTCDVIVAAKEAIGARLIEGICGQVDGSVIPGLIGLEAGQSALGDVYAWFRGILAWPLDSLLGEVGVVDEAIARRLRSEVEPKILARLSTEAAKLDAEGSGLLALDWLNGRRTPFADQKLKGAIMGLTLGTTAPHIFRALVEATAFGAKAIVERFQQEGVAITQVVAVGGIAKRNDFVMQITADVLDMPIQVCASDQVCAVGAAIFGAVAAGLYATVEEAGNKLASSYLRTFYPRPDLAARYRLLFRTYVDVGARLEEPLRQLGSAAQRS